ncbi:hypothetical protein VPH35_117514 [Triticum aestivum]
MAPKASLLVGLSLVLVFTVANAVRRQLPDADSGDPDADAVPQQVPQERAEARCVRRRPGPRQRRGRPAAGRAVLQHPRRPRRPRGRRLPLHGHQGQRARHQPRHPRQAQPPRQLLRQEPPKWLHLRLIKLRSSSCSCMQRAHMNTAFIRDCMHVGFVDILVCLLCWF